MNETLTTTGCDKQYAFTKKQYKCKCFRGTIKQAVLCPLSSLQIFHYTGGVAYVDNKGPFRDRLEFVGNPGRRDGSILLKNLDFNDNGTFTCDAKNPPDIVGRPSSVRLLVFEKGETEGRMGSPVGVSQLNQISPYVKSNACIVLHLCLLIIFPLSPYGHILVILFSSEANCSQLLL